ncbi:hypothetical protein SteCoe_29710 [Stentor coeruleus]|uniref:U-box domain-containing protein n=1 Tax=Stentor coeruleus TaxID=5963 RepID=A0A1R2B5B2_9CILI|nr:hypothetical protein SteCoe_29710 [Stentor coeruleus]
MFNHFKLFASNASNKFKEEKGKFKEEVAKMKEKIRDNQQKVLAKLHDTLHLHKGPGGKKSFRKYQRKSSEENPPAEENHKEEVKEGHKEDENEQFEGENDLLLCPISQELMTDPVMTPYGHCFQRKNIEAWLSNHKTCPLTNNPLEISQLVPCYTVKAIVEEHIKSLKGK